MPKPFWKFQNVAGGRAELLLYGDISDSTWWGDEVTPKQFAEDLDKLGAVSEITVRINSGGGTVENTPPAGKTDEFLDAIKSVGQNAQKK